MIIGRRAFAALPFASMVCARMPAFAPDILPGARESGISRIVGHGNAPEEFCRLPAKDYVNAVAWNRDGTRLAVLSSFSSQITIWDTARWAIAKTFHRYSGGNQANSLAYLPDGTLLTSAPAGKSPDPRYKTLAIFSLIQWNLDTGRPVRYIPDLSKLSGDAKSAITPALSFAASADGSLAAAVMGNSVLVFDLHAGTLLRRIVVQHRRGGDFAESVAFSEDGRIFAIGTGGGWVVFQAMDGTSPHTSFQAYRAPPYNYNGRGAQNRGVNALAFRPDGRYLVTGAEGMSVGDADNGWVRVWDVKTSLMVGRMAGGTGTVWGAAWDPTGNILAVGDELSIRFWWTGNLPQAPRLLERVSDRTYSLAFSPSGILAVSDNQEVVIYR